jgi:hypothetical protein
MRKLITRYWKLENVKRLLDENTEMERLRETAEERVRISWCGRSGGVLKRRVEELEVNNEDLHAKLEEQPETITRHEEKEDLTRQNRSSPTRH